MMRQLLLRATIIALLAGPTIALVNSVLWMRPAVRYEPPLTEAEYNRLSDLSVAKMNAILDAREVRMTRTEALVESISASHFWRNLAKNSLVPSLGVFIACIWLGSFERRRAQHHPKTGSTSSPKSLNA